MVDNMKACPPFLPCLEAKEREGTPGPVQFAGSDHWAWKIGFDKWKTESEGPLFLTRDVIIGKNSRQKSD
jgi:hypothetical protein